jgi:hypothetical protein
MPSCNFSKGHQTTNQTTETAAHAGRASNGSVGQRHGMNVKLPSAPPTSEIHKELEHIIG